MSVASNPTGALIPTRIHTVLKRTLSTLTLWALVVAAVVFFKRDGIVVLCTVAAAAAQYELYRMLEKLGHRPFVRLGVVLGVLLILVPYFLRKLLDSHAVDAGPKEGMESALIAITIVACCLRVMRERTGAHRMETLIATVFGLVYIPFMMFFFVRILWLGGEREIIGIMLAVWLLVAAKFCDVGALLVGSLIGRHKMAPTMSPAKTWEGAVGGVIIASSLCAALPAIFRDLYPPGFTPLISGLLAIPPAIVSITSDLVESVLKRMAGVKDSGSTIPGIGGAFDLVDSLILAAPTGFLLLRFVV